MQAPSEELLNRFYHQQCTADEHDYVVKWFQQEPESLVTAAMWKRWETLSTMVVRPGDPNLFEKIEKARRNPVRPLHPLWQGWRRVAAWSGLVLLAGMIALWSWWSGSTTLVTSYGQLARVTLSDGSLVVLNGNSQLTYPRHWVSGNREVELSGEAFFKVTHTRDHRKFVVRTAQGMVVEVLGTQFNVRHRQRGTEVVLNSGKIRLHLPPVAGHAEQTILMRPSQQVSFQRDGRHYQKRWVNPAQQSAWTEGKLLLLATPLSEVLPIIEDTYGLKTRVANPGLLRLTGTGSIPARDPEVMLTVLAEMFELTIRRSGDEVIFAPQ